MSDVTVHHMLDSTLESVDRVESLTLEVAKRAGFRGVSLDQIILAVHETTANAVIHGNRFNKEKNVSVAISITKNQLEITIEDEGDGFDPGAVPDPLSLQELLRDSGRGVYLARALMDQYKVQRRETGGTKVTLIKYLQPLKLVVHQVCH
jgi:serine/threonine-protein kinase RsbW